MLHRFCQVKPLLSCGAASQRLVSARCFSSARKCKVLVVGGGSGGCSVSAKLSSKLGPGKVVILDPAESHYYQPMFTLIGGGMKKLEDSVTPMKETLPSLATWVQDSVMQFEPEANTVITKKGDRIEYEEMVIAVGLELRYDKVPGLVEALAIPGGKVCSNYSPKYVNRTLEALNNFQQGNAIFTFPNSPVKCPGAPQKAAYLAEHYLRRAKKRKDARIIYNTALPVIFGVKHYADALWKVAKKREVTVNLRMNLKQVFPERNQAVFENLDKPGEESTMDYSLLHVTPPMATPDVLLSCPGLTNAAGFVDVNKHTLQHVKYPNIFAIGDCSSTPNSKTAASVAAQAPVVYRNLLAVMEGNPPSASYNGYASCPLVTGYNSCILAEFDYDLQPLETFPIPQDKERYSMLLLKKHFMPFLYWQFMLNGMWNGPAIVKTLLDVLRKEKTIQ
ncbi:sulfide:quinone oxidoreductase, mitochondrial [Phlebotomus argentipes]|uniref:sulfide:quinone oxidoreductase, mitochondrial n=1 Tax=Phlebotomus argentipes TaxID=94469 RepID=UPI0028931B53|nr:sulfide:quinone oxidoreductase, mitochondrial [Phlebotomus argentipes]